MEIFQDIVRVYQANIIRAAFFSVLTIAIVCRFYRQLPLRFALSPLRWAILGFCLMQIVLMAISLINGQISLDRITGPYWWSYLLMVISVTILPFSVLHSKLRNSVGWLLIVSVLINLGWMFELFVIITTSLHRDYMPSSWSDGPSGYIWNLSATLGILALQGIIVGLLSTLIGNLIFRLAKKNIFAQSFIKQQHNESAF